MATMETKQVEDFSDLGQSFYFSYLGTNYVIPPIPPAKAKRLIKISKKLTDDKDVKKVVNEEGNISENVEEMESSMDKMFSAQCEFISESGIKKYTDPEMTTFVDVSEEEIEENWSTQLVLKIFEKINSIIFGTAMKSEEKKS